MRRVVFVARHGETDWNAEGRWQGHTDIPLNDIGREQSRTLADSLRGEKLSGVVSSDLSRARETGEIVAATLAVRFHYADADLRERKFGVFEGLTRRQCEDQHGEAWNAYMAKRILPQGAEPHEALQARIVRAVQKVAETVATEEDGALIVTHGGSLRALVEHVTGVAGNPIANAALFRFVWTGSFSAVKSLKYGDE